MCICVISFIILLLLSIISFNFALMSIYFNMSMVMEWEIINLNSISINMVMIFDWMSLLFMSLVMLISSLVIFYSKSYMSKEKNLNRFIILVLLFVLSMMFMIISPNLISILLGWDGLGLVSYCLVVYFQNVKSYNAGMLTVLSNRVGDVMILMSIGWMLNYGGWNFIYYLEFMKNEVIMMIIGSLVMIAAMTKSAQIPFSSWLPAAMAAPTPVSALVHSSTLVTAGVYLMIRFSNLLCDTLLFKILLVISGMTMLMSGLAANFEFDLKKIIALSTLSQLGLMMMILSIGSFSLAFFHLLTHAMFKALLFMCAGGLIHSMVDFQDIRFMGGVMKYVPNMSACFLIANFALCGMPFMAGFYSKDLILEYSLSLNMNWVVFFFFFFSTGLTVSYSVRLIYFGLLSNLSTLSFLNFHDEDYIMVFSMLILMLFSIFGGSMLAWLMFSSMKMIYLSMNLKFMVIYVIFLGLMVGLMLMYFPHMNFMKMKFSMFIISFMKLMWFLPNLSTWGVILNWLILGNKVKSNLDFGWGEKLGGQGIFSILKIMNLINFYLQLNFFKLWIMFFMLWLGLFLLFLI
uniref:NADH dehydrogenase subunit 5 n=1 Tax=Agapetus zniachtl TaxID=1875106 RepID=UPI0022DCDEC4|nr:NADH dehydrogenase subunit 5 [Agapetus zniachtl]UZZ43734.1 NADH dehydrogenase subunit 5 [Agapetus zniachtl]